MKFLEYIGLAVRTESPRHFNGIDTRVVHAAIGLMTEAVELHQFSTMVNLKEELGDICWYAAIAMDSFGLNDESSMASIGLESEVPTVNVSSERRVMVIIYAASDKEILDSVRIICNAHGILFSDVLESNIRKLKARYPEKFTSEKAIVRDLAAESEALK
jgi:NTP pyrophosphatase (non-canonical NTP hydrolase)